MNEREVGIVIKAYNQYDKVFAGVEQDLDKVSTSSEKVNKTTTQTFNGMLKGVGHIRRGLSLLGSAYALTFGIAVASIKKSTEAMDNMRDSSIELGMSLDTMQRMRTGAIFDEKELKHAEQSINALGAMWQGFLTAIGITYSKLVPKMGEVNTMTEKQTDIIVGLTDATNKLTMSADKYATTRVNIDYEKYKNALNLDQSLSPEQMKIREDALNKWRTASLEDLAKKKLETENKYRAEYLSAEGRTTEALQLEWDTRIRQAEKFSDEAGRLAELTAQKQIEQAQLARFGLEDSFRAMERTAQEATSNIQSYFGDVFIDGLDNNFKNAKSITARFLTDLRNMFIRSAIEQLIIQLVKSAGTMNAVGATFASAGLATVASVASGMESSGSYSDINMQSGYNDWMSGMRDSGGSIPKTGMYLMHRGENVEPYSKSKSGGDSDDAKMVVYNINAVDAKSFAQLVAQNPDIIHNTVSNGMRYNKGMRGALREGLR